MEDDQLVLRIHPDIKRRFKMVCGREGDDMTHKIRRWIYLYLQEHEKGNPQTLLEPKNELEQLESKNRESLLRQVLDEKLEPEFIFNRIRREVIVELAKFLNEHGDMKRSDAIQLFALRHGFRTDTIREYVRLLDSQATEKRSDG